MNARTESFVNLTSNIHHFTQHKSGVEAKEASGTQVSERFSFFPENNFRCDYNCLHFHKYRRTRETYVCAVDLYRFSTRVSTVHESEDEIIVSAYNLDCWLCCRCWSEKLSSVCVGGSTERKDQKITQPFVFMPSYAVIQDNNFHTILFFFVCDEPVRRHLQTTIQMYIRHTHTHQVMLFICFRVIFGGQRT